MAVGAAYLCAACTHYSSQRKLLFSEKLREPDDTRVPPTPFEGGHGVAGKACLLVAVLVAGGLWF
jgi:hypothetical protein